MSRPELTSVIVPARDAERTLPQTMASLAAQEYQGEWELVVVDNGSRDRTREIAQRELARFPAARLVGAKGHAGAGPARNVGAAAARGDFLVFCDSDDMPEPGWLGALVEAADGAAVVSGALHIDRLNDQRTRTSFPAPRRYRPTEAHGFLPFAYGGNCGVWTEVFQSVGGFDESYRFGQDVDFCWRAQLAGHRFGFAAEAVMQRRLRGDFKGIALQHVRWGAAAVHLYARYRSAGMPRGSIVRAVVDWVGLLVSLPVAATVPVVRGEWARRAGLRVGKAVGSIRYGVLYL
jgi:glycosyltransferase involved in cell wall biosynthesis